MTLTIFWSVINRSKRWLSYPIKLKDDLKYRRYLSGLPKLKVPSIGSFFGIDKFLSMFDDIKKASQLDELIHFARRSVQFAKIDGVMKESPILDSVESEFTDLLKTGPVMDDKVPLSKWWRTFRDRLVKGLSIGLYQDFLRRSVYTLPNLHNGMLPISMDYGYSTADIQEMNLPRFYPGEGIPSCLDETVNIGSRYKNLGLIVNGDSADHFDLFLSLVRDCRNIQLFPSYTKVQDFGFGEVFSSEDLLEAFWVRTYRRMLRYQSASVIKKGLPEHLKTLHVKSNYMRERPSGTIFTDCFISE